MDQDGGSLWVSTLRIAADRLAAEADTEVDELLARPDCTSLGLFATLMERLEGSANINEVAVDLVGVLWAAGVNLGTIGDLVADSAARPALDVVVEARHRGARRLADGAVAEAARRSTRRQTG